MNSKLKNCENIKKSELSDLSFLFCLFNFLSKKTLETLEKYSQDARIFMTPEQDENQEEFLLFLIFF